MQRLPAAPRPPHKPSDRPGKRAWPWGRPRQPLRARSSETAFRRLEWSSTRTPPRPRFDTGVDHGRDHLRMGGRPPLRRASNLALALQHDDLTRSNEARHAPRAIAFIIASRGPPLATTRSGNEFGSWPAVSEVDPGGSVSGSAGAEARIRPQKGRHSGEGVRRRASRRAVQETPAIHPIGRWALSLLTPIHRASPSMIF